MSSRDKGSGERVFESAEVQGQGQGQGHVQLQLQVQEQGEVEGEAEAGSGSGSGSGSECEPRKSAMCLVNELARFNDVAHQYHLVDEVGPPHQKTFTVVLKLGDHEEYKSSGPSIRKAQHAAASAALVETKLSHPAPKAQRKSSLHRTTWPLTPTVELNVLAMKRGEPALYHVFEPRPTPSGPLTPYGAAAAVAGIYDFRGMYNQRYHYPRGPYCASVTVGDKQFIGKGKTAQSARHAAAEEALKFMREVPLPDHRQSKVSTSDDESIKSPISLVHELALKRNMNVKFEVVSEAGPSHMPSFVTRCIVGENLVTEGEGNGKKLSKRTAAEKMLEELKKLSPLPSTQKIDLTDAQVNKTTRRKVFPKKKRGSNLIKEKNTLENGNGNLSECDSTCNQTDDNQANGESGDSEPIGSEVKQIISNCNQSQLMIHPINRLIQLQQARKEREPLFKVVTERNLDRKRKEFVIECSISNNKNFCNINGSNSSVISATGMGPNKKVAKKNAAEAMLHLLGYSSKGEQQASLSQSQSLPSTPASILKPQPPVNLQDNCELLEAQGQKVRKVKFVDVSETNGGQPQPPVGYQQSGHGEKQQMSKFGRQLVPGLLLMQSPEDGYNAGNLPVAHSPATASTEGETLVSKPNGLSSGDSDARVAELSCLMAKEMLEKGCSPTAASLLQAAGDSSTPGSPILIITRPFLQLQYIANSLGTAFQLHVSDFPKQNKSEFLTVVTVTTNPPRVCHGLGPSADASRDAAALQVLKAFATSTGSAPASESSVTGSQDSQLPPFS